MTGRFGDRDPEPDYDPSRYTVARRPPEAAQIFKSIVAQLTARVEERKEGLPQNCNGCSATDPEVQHLRYLTDEAIDGISLSAMPAEVLGARVLTACALIKQDNLKNGVACEGLSQGETLKVVDDLNAKEVTYVTLRGEPQCGQDRSGQVPPVDQEILTRYNLT